MCLAALQAWPDDLGEVVAKILRTDFPFAIFETHGFG